ncbi:MAG: hypothetical protein ACRELA_16770 [Candidatus Rokuibacteriota bacterium]
MRPSVAAVVIVTMVALSVAGCATQTQTGAAVGGAAGAGLGAIIGGLMGGQKGALIGAGVGAVAGAGAGALIGRYLDQKVADRSAAARRVGYVPRSNDLVEVQRSEVVPRAVKPGQSVVSRVEYSVLAPNPDQRVEFRERRVVQRDGQTVIGPVERQIRKEQGVHQSAYEFQLPGDTPAGQYTVVTVVELGEGTSAQRKTAEVPLTVQ